MKLVLFYVCFPSRCATTGESETAIIMGMVLIWIVDHILVGSFSEASAQMCCKMACTHLFS